MLSASLNKAFPSFLFYRDGPIEIKNKHIAEMDEDVLYHIALGTKSHDLKDMFSDIKVIFKSTLSWIYRTSGSKPYWRY